METPLRRQIRVRDDKSSVHDIIADGLDQKAFTRSVPSDYEAERRAALLYDVHVVKKRFDLALSSDCNIGQTDPRNDTALE